jgi:hypothetical protein
MYQVNMMNNAASGMDVPLPVNSTVDGNVSDDRDSSCYHAGDSIAWWLNRQSADNSMQHRKTNILSRLAAGNCQTQILMDIGDHLTTSLEALMILTQDESADVRFALAENHNIDESVLNRLVDDTNPYVAYRAQKTLARLRTA